MLATFWWPNTNPIGPASLWPLGIVTIVAIVAYLTRSRAIVFAAAAIFAVLSVLGFGLPFIGRRFPNADDFVGYYIWNLAACCFAWETARSGSLRSLTYAGLVILPMGWLLVLEIFVHSLHLMRLSQLLTELQLLFITSGLWGVLFLLLMYRAARPYRRASRIARGLCGNCGYDLRETPQRCPECGTAPVSMFHAIGAQRATPQISRDDRDPLN